MIDQARSRLGLAALEAWTEGVASKDGRGRLDDLPLWYTVQEEDGRRDTDRS